jgi:hypothetical protein
MLWLAGALAVAAGFGGLYVSYYLDTAAGASIAGVTVVMYAAAAAGAALARGFGQLRRPDAAVGAREPGYARTP